MVDSISMTEQHFRPVPVYKYPEHLNPFYEDENHKRLRFFSLTRKKDGRPRSNSFSVANLRDLWSFKSLRLRKKPSVLGINKTSESPPALRKHELYDSNFNNYDSTCRQTYSNGGNDAFQRNVPYRASMGNLNSRNYDTQSDVVPFNRTDGYRNTIQNVHRGQRYNGSITPVLGQKFANGVGMTPGSSQTSLRSTNPFEDEANPKAPVRRYRKKRPAPPPPVQSKYMPRVSEQSGSSDNIELKIVEEDHPMELPSISSLTAEIEILTKSVQEAPKKETTPVIDTQISRKSPEKSHNERVSSLKDSIETPAEDSTMQETYYVNEMSYNQKLDLDKSVELDKSQEEILVEEKKLNGSVLMETDEEPIELRDKRINATDEAKIDSLRIVEPDRYEIRYLPLKEEPSRRLDKETIRAEFVRSTSKDSDLSQEVQHNGERRRSVKEIIESINRSQGMLMGTNYTPMHGKYEYGDFNDRPQLPSKSETSEELEVELRDKERHSYYDNVPEILEKLEEQSASFERCSPGRGSIKKSPSYEWNPVPKPRRSHNFSADIKD